MDRLIAALSLLALAFCILPTYEARSCSIELRNNEFSLMIGIADGVPKRRRMRDRHDYDDLAESLRNLSIKGSQHLYTASKRRAFIKDVTVVVPDDWQETSNLRIECARQCETYERAKVKIRQPRRDSRGREMHGAYVIPGRCGEEGSLMHLTASRVASPGHRASPPEKMFVHELAHLRWGVGDEYFQSFYGYGADGRPSRCAVAVEPQISRFTGRYSSFAINNARGSFMWQQFRRQITEFCDDSSDRRVQHNRQAANSHNQRCGRDSVWTVLRRSRDFAGNNNPPRYLNANDIRPTVRFVKKCDSVSQSQSACEIIAVDVSASMTGRMVQVMHAAATVIDQAPASTNLGLMPFTTYSHTGVSLRRADRSAKAYLKQRLPTNSAVRKEHTDIRAAIMEAARRLNTKVPGCSRKKITILSDCGQTSGDPVDSVLVQFLRRNNIAVNSLTFDDNTPRCMLPELSRLSEGFSCNQGDPLADDAAIEDCMAKQTPKDIPNAEMRVHFSMTTLQPHRKICKSVCIEHEIGSMTTFTLNWNKPLKKSMAERVWHLTTPGGRTIRFRRVGGYTVDTNLMMSSFYVDPAEAGNWQVCLRNRYTSEVTFTMNVNSHARNYNQPAIEAEGFLGKRDIEAPEPQTILVELTKGMSPVLHAHVSCTITRPSSPPRTLILYDDGFDDDDMKDDGIYTAMFTQYMGDGQYNVHCVATCRYNGDDDSMMTQVRRRPKRMDDAGEESDQPESGMGMPDNDDDEVGMEIEMDHCCFARHISLGSFAVRGYAMKRMQVLERDMVAPSAVKDLRVVSFNNATYPYTIRLRFTATGNDMEVGDASLYVLRWSTMFAGLDDPMMFNNSAIAEVIGPNQLENPPRKRSAMSKVTVEVTVQICLPAMYENEVFFALKALDETGNVSPLSNIARLHFIDQRHSRHCPSPAEGAHRCCSNMDVYSLPDVSWMVENGQSTGSLS